MPVARIAGSQRIANVRVARAEHADEATPSLTVVVVVCGANGDDRRLLLLLLLRGSLYLLLVMVFRRRVRITHNPVRQTVDVRPASDVSYHRQSAFSSGVAS